MIDPIKNNWKTVLTVAGVTLTLVAVGASVVATGGLTAPLEFEIGGEAITAAIRVAQVASAGAAGVNVALTASDCSQNALGPKCAADVAAALIGAGYEKYSYQAVKRVLGRKVAQQIGTQQGANIGNILQAVTTVRDRSQQRFGC